MGSVIGAGTSVRGNIEGEGSLEILGRVEGDVVMTGTVTIGEGGAVLGNVSAAEINVQGAVKGELRGAQAVLLASPARVVGDISAPRIGIGAGALVRGNVRTEGEPAIAVGKRAPAAAVVPFKAAFPPKPVAKVEAKPPLPPPSEEQDEEELEDEGDEGEESADSAAAPVPLPTRPREKEAERRPPPPVLPSLGKGAKAKKKKG